MSADAPETKGVFRIIAEPGTAYKDEDKNIQLLAVGLDRTQLSSSDDSEQNKDTYYHWRLEAGPKDFDLEDTNNDLKQNRSPKTTLATEGLLSGRYVIRVQATTNSTGPSDRDPTATTSVTVEPSIQRQVHEKVIRDGLPIETRQPEPTNDQGFWVKLRQCINGRTFARYDEFLKGVLCDRNGRDEGLLDIKDSDCYYRHGVHGYELIDAATEVFLLCQACCGGMGEISEEGFDPEREALRLGYESTPEAMNVRLNGYLKSNVSSRTLPYLDRILRNMELTNLREERFPFCPDNIRIHVCLFELIWSYYLDLGMVDQTLKAIALRFQNRRVTRNGRDPLANFEINPLRPLNNLLWGYIQKSNHQLSLKRRVYEYEHEYGLSLIGKAVGRTDPAERRSEFLEAFHNLLHRCSVFYRDNSNKMIVPDAFPLLGAIRAVHLLLAAGAGNEWGDMPVQARQQFMISQWLLSQPPMREFLHSRATVPYDEPWMGQVDAMKRLMGWTDVSIMHFHKLANFGEIVLLSIRFGDWNDSATLSEQARNWALYFKPEIQGYMEAYRTVTGVDLSADVQKIDRVDATLPAVHLQRRTRSKNSVAERISN